MKSNPLNQVTVNNIKYYRKIHEFYNMKHESKQYKEDTSKLKKRKKI